jgi:hypothetical protein
VCRELQKFYLVRAKNRIMGGQGRVIEKRNWRGRSDRSGKASHALLKHLHFGSWELWGIKWWERLLFWEVPPTSTKQRMDWRLPDGHVEEPGHNASVSLYCTLESQLDLARPLDPRLVSAQTLLVPFYCGWLVSSELVYTRFSHLISVPQLRSYLSDLLCD